MSTWSGVWDAPHWGGLGSNRVGFDGYLHDHGDTRGFTTWQARTDLIRNRCTNRAERNRPPFEIYNSTRPDFMARFLKDWEKYVEYKIKKGICQPEERNKIPSWEKDISQYTNIVKIGKRQVPDYQSLQLVRPVDDSGWQSQNYIFARKEDWEASRMIQKNIPAWGTKREYKPTSVNPRNVLLHGCRVARLICEDSLDLADRGESPYLGLQDHVVPQDMASTRVHCRSSTQCTVPITMAIWGVDQWLALEIMNSYWLVKRALEQSRDQKSFIIYPNLNHTLTVGSQINTHMLLLMANMFQVLIKETDLTDCARAAKVLEAVFHAKEKLFADPRLPRNARGRLISKTDYPMSKAQTRLTWRVAKVLGEGALELPEYLQMTPYKVIEFGRATPERGGETGQDVQIFGRESFGL